MITLYSYPELFGVADNNGYGLKVFVFLHAGGLIYYGPDLRESLTVLYIAW